MIENPDMPLAKNTESIFQLLEIWNIADENDQFYFRYAHNLQVAPDESISLIDSEQFLKFSLGRKFLLNLYKKEEPKECNISHLKEKEFFLTNQYLRNE